MRLRRWVTAANPDGEWQTVVSEDAVVLHYAYSYLSDVRDKAGKSCPGAEYLAAAKRATGPRCAPPRYCCSGGGGGGDRWPPRPCTTTC